MRNRHRKLIDLVKKGIPDKEIMKELNIQTRTSLKKMYYEALVEAGKIKAIITEREKKRKRRKPKILTIGKRGTLALSRVMLIDQFGFKEGDKFKVSKRGDSITLKKNGGDYPGPKRRVERK